MAEKPSPTASRSYCYPQCRDPWFQECADCWRDGGNTALAVRQNESMPWRIEFWANVPGTPFAAPYMYGPYESQLDARIDAALLRDVERVEITRASEDSFAWPSYPPGSRFS